MGIFEAISPVEIARLEPEIRAAPLVVADANLCEATLALCPSLWP